MKVLLYPSNLVSYARVGLLPYTAHAAFTRDWKRLGSGYGALLASDVLHGAVAKSLRQDSQLGRSMDLIIDHIGSLIIAHEVARLYPVHASVVWSIALVGLASHWLQDKAAGESSHVKNMAHMPSLVRRFYRNSLLFTYCVLGPKLLALGLVVLKHSGQYEPLIRTAMTAVAPSLILKTMIDVFALLGAMYSLAHTHATGIESKYSAMAEKLRTAELQKQPTNDAPKPAATNGAQQKGGSPQPKKQRPAQAQQQPQHQRPRKR